MKIISFICAVICMAVIFSPARADTAGYAETEQSPVISNNSEEELIADENNLAAEDMKPAQGEINIISSDNLPTGLHYRMKEDGE